MEVTSQRRCGNYHQGATQSSPSTIYHRSRRRRMRGFSPLLINSMQAEGFLLPTLSGRFDVVPPNDDDCPLSAGAAGSAPTVPTGLADLLLGSATPPISSTSQLPASGTSSSSRGSGVPFVLLRAGPSASVSAEGQRGTGVVGHIHQEVRVRAERAMTIRMLVDTGATFSVVPRRLARALGIRRPRRSVSVRLADGRRVRLGADVAIIRIDGREAPATLLVGDVDEPILGVEALEALGLVVDPRKKRLSPPALRGAPRRLPLICLAADPVEMPAGGDLASRRGEAY